MWDPKWHEVGMPVYLASYHRSRSLPRIDQATKPQSSRNSFPSPMFRPLRPVLNLGHFGHFDLVHSLGRGRHTPRGKSIQVGKNPASMLLEMSRWFHTPRNTKSGTIRPWFMKYIRSKIPSPHFCCQTSHNNGCKSVFFNKNDSWSDTIPHMR